MQTIVQKKIFYFHLSFPGTECWLPPPCPTQPNSSLLVGPLVEARGRFSRGSGQNYERTPRAAKRRDSQPVARCVPGREVARGKGKTSGLSLTCRRSFHRAAAKGSDTGSLWEEPPLAGPSSAAHSASRAWVSATGDSIPWNPPVPRAVAATTLPCQDLSTCSQPGPVSWTSLRPPQSPRPPRIPHFRYSRLLGNRGSAAGVIAPFCRWPSLVRADRKAWERWQN